jgi:hypothetical protein
MAHEKKRKQALSLMLTASGISFKRRAMSLKKCFVEALLTSPPLSHLRLAK